MTAMTKVTTRARNLGTIIVVLSMLVAGAVAGRVFAFDACTSPEFDGSETSCPSVVNTGEDIALSCAFQCCYDDPNCTNFALSSHWHVYKKLFRSFTGYVLGDYLYDTQDTTCDCE